MFAGGELAKHEAYDRNKCGTRDSSKWCADTSDQRAGWKITKWANAHQKQSIEAHDLSALLSGNASL
jgi:hypothetical protein